jgi:hypothetical protein
MWDSNKQNYCKLLACKPVLHYNYAEHSDAGYRAGYMSLFGSRTILTPLWYILFTRAPTFIGLRRHTLLYTPHYRSARPTKGVKFQFLFNEKVTSLKRSDVLTPSKIEIAFMSEVTTCNVVHIKLIPLIWVLLEKPLVAQLLNNFPAIYGTRKFITVFTWTLNTMTSYL